MLNDALPGPYVVARVTRGVLVAHRYTLRHLAVPQGFCSQLGQQYNVVPTPARGNTCANIVPTLVRGNTCASVVPTRVRGNTCASVVRTLVRGNTCASVVSTPARGTTCATVVPTPARGKSKNKIKVTKVAK